MASDIENVVNEMVNEMVNEIVNENVQTKKSGEPPSKKRKVAAKTGGDSTLEKVKAQKSRTTPRKITKRKRDATPDNRKSQLTTKKSHMSKADSIKLVLLFINL